jgi:hypothetical protein
MYEMHPACSLKPGVTEAEVRSALIKSKLPDLGRTPEFQRLVAECGRGGAAQSRGEVSPEMRGLATVML